MGSGPPGVPRTWAPRAQSGGAPFAEGGGAKLGSPSPRRRAHRVSLPESTPRCGPPDLPHSRTRAHATAAPPPRDPAGQRGRPASGRGAHFELVHDFADGFAASTDDAGVDAVVQGDVLGNHLFELTHDFEDGVPGGFCVLFVPCDGDLVLGLRRENPVRTMPGRAGGAEPGRPLQGEQEGGRTQQEADSKEQVREAPSAPDPSPKGHRKATAGTEGPCRGGDQTLAGEGSGPLVWRGLGCRRSPPEEGVWPCWAQRPTATVRPGLGPGPSRAREAPAGRVGN